MLKFFRQIRQQFIHEGRVSKYLIYAIGEIALVMIGILLALQVNNWNQNRLNKQKENELINDLKEDLKADLAMLSANLNIIKAKKRFLLSILSEKTMESNMIKSWLHPESGVSASMLFQSRMQDALSIRDYTYKEMVATGTLSLMTNDNLKEAILDHYRLVENRKQTLDDTFSDWPKVLSEFIPAEGNLHIKFNQNNVLPNEELNILFKSLQKSKESLRPTINAEVQYNGKARITYNMLIKNVEDLLKIIESMQSED